MILTCPACAKRYRVADTAVPPEGRTVRCAACGNSWFQDAAPTGPVVEAAPPPPPPPAPKIWREEPAPQRVAPPPPPSPPQIIKRETRPRRAASTANPWNLPAIVASLMLFGLVGLARPGGIGGFDPALGLSPVAPNEVVLSIDAPLIGPGIDGSAVLTLFGKLSNPSRRAQVVQPIHVDVRDPHSTLIASWTSPPPLPLLNPGVSVAFETAAGGIPRNAARARVNFAEGPRPN